ncbi:MAG: DUF1573 domain-containing protein [Sumerlaeia bacterium]
MKRLAICSAIICIGFANVYAQPKLSIESHIDFGEVEIGENMELVIPAKNVGDQTLELQRASKSCVCTEVTVPKSTIEPGEEMPITVALDPEKISGSQRTVTISLFTNDPKKLHAVTLDFTLVEPYTYRPKVVAFDENTSRTTVHIYKRAGKDLTVKTVESSIDGVSHKLSTGRSGEIEVEFFYSGAEIAKSLDGVTTIRFQEDVPNLEIQTKLISPSEIIFAPTVVLVSFKSSANTEVHVASIELNSKNEFGIVSTKVESGYLRVEHAEGASRDHKVLLYWQEGQVPETSQFMKSKILITTSVQDEPIELPIYFTP